MAELLASGLSIAPREPEDSEPIDARQREAIQATMSSDVGVLRDADGLALAAKSLEVLLAGGRFRAPLGCRLRGRQPRCSGRGHRRGRRGEARVSGFARPR